MISISSPLSSETWIGISIVGMSVDFFRNSSRARKQEEEEEEKSGFLSFVLFKEKKTSVRKSEWFGGREKERRRPIVDKTSSSSSFSCKNLRILSGGLRKSKQDRFYSSLEIISRDFNSSSNYISAHLSRSLTLYVWRVTVSFSFPLDFTRAHPK